MIQLGKTGQYDYSKICLIFFGFYMGIIGAKTGDKIIDIC